MQRPYIFMFNARQHLLQAVKRWIGACCRYATAIIPMPLPSNLQAMAVAHNAAGCRISLQYQETGLNSLLLIILLAIPFF